MGLSGVYVFGGAHTILNTEFGQVEAASVATVYEQPRQVSGVEYLQVFLDLNLDGFISFDKTELTMPVYRIKTELGLKQDQAQPFVVKGLTIALQVVQDFMQALHKINRLEPNSLGEQDVQLYGGSTGVISYYFSDDRVVEAKLKSGCYDLVGTYGIESGAFEIEGSLMFKGWALKIYVNGHYEWCSVQYCSPQLVEVEICCNPLESDIQMTLSLERLE